MLKQNLVADFKKAVPVIRVLVQHLSWLENEFQPEKATEEERSIVSHLLALGVHCFDESDWRLARCLAEIKEEGHLKRNANKRFEIQGKNIELTCGSYCEVYAPYFSDDANELMTWLPTTVEYNTDYYFTVRPQMAMEGALVRIRQSGVPA